VKETASIHVVRLEAADDFDGWRDRARGCLMAGLAPDRVVWMEPDGAGDLFAAGFLFGHARGEDLPTCLAMGAVAAAEIIAHYGARPEADLRALMEGRFG